MSSDIAVSVRNLTKTYRLFAHPGDRIKQAATFGLRKYHEEFTALKDVSFDIRKGEKVGIIGRNGSGKSTLLQMICGILKPTAGTVEVNGRVSALLELGAGFNPEFTGRENVYFQGALMGLGKEEMDRRFDYIAVFADIGTFIDQPVRTYSSGMFVRLAFAVATSLDPDMFIVDEALSVGDASFQFKSRQRMKELSKSGATVIVVSHDRSTITGLCDRSVLLDQGTLLMDGFPADVFDYYHALLAAKETQGVGKRLLDSGRHQIVSGTGQARVESIRILDGQLSEVDTFEVGQTIVLEFEVSVHDSLPRLVLGFTIRDEFGQTIFGINTNSYGMSVQSPEAGRRYRFRFAGLSVLGVGHFSISTALVSTNDRFTDNYECRELARLFDVRNTSKPSFGGPVWLDLGLSVERL